MFGPKNQKNSAVQKDVLRKAREGQLLTEDEVMIYVRAYQDINQEQLGGEVRPYSVLWFDPARKRSVVVHTKAGDGVEAVANVMNDIPPCVNCNAVVGHIPTTVRFAPDQLFVT
jgi:hypothetical protein